MIEDMNYDSNDPQDQNFLNDQELSFHYGLRSGCITDGHDCNDYPLLVYVSIFH